MHARKHFDLTLGERTSLIDLLKENKDAWSIELEELSRLRFTLRPHHLKEQQFWNIYFMLVKSHVAEYELQAIRLAKLKGMAMENEKSSDTGAFDVEMAEAKQADILALPTPRDHNLYSLKMLKFRWSWY